MRAPTEAVLGAFCDHFNLNQDARNKLRELTPELQTIAVEQFDPPASADNNGKFILYARSLQQASQQGKLERFKGPSGTRAMFDKAMSMDNSASIDVVDSSAQNSGYATMMAMLDGGIQGGNMQGGTSNMENSGYATMMDMFGGNMQDGGMHGNKMGQDMLGGQKRPFDSAPVVVPKRYRNGPTPTISDPISMLNEQMNRQPGSASSERLMSAEIPNPKAKTNIAAFAELWRLNAEAQLKLFHLSPPALEAVLRKFEPLGAADPNMDWSNKLTTFASKVEMALKNDPVVAFIERWNLNELSQIKLQSLDTNQLEAVLYEFRPPAEADVVDEYFISLANSLQINSMMPAQNLTPSTGMSNMNPLNSNMTSMHPLKSTSNEGAADNDRVTSFIQRWNLNEDAQRKLYSLSPPQLQVVLNDFKPPPDQTADCNGKFIMFANSIVKNQLVWQQQTFDANFDQVALFIQKWNLNADSQAKLKQLTPEQLQIVLNDFRPPLHQSQEVNGKFIKFAASIQRNQANQMLQADGWIRL